MFKYVQQVKKQEIRSCNYQGSLVLQTRIRVIYFLDLRHATVNIWHLNIWFIFEIFLYIIQGLFFIGGHIVFFKIFYRINHLFSINFRSRKYIMYLLRFIAWFFFTLMVCWYINTLSCFNFGNLEAYLIMCLYGSSLK